MNTDLQGRTVVVTGASGLLGGHLVRAFAAHGATIAAVVPSEDEARRVVVPEGAQVWAFPADVTAEADVRRAFDAIQGQFGRLDVLVHAVGAWESSSILETSLEAWERVLRLNLTSAFLCFREAARLMTGRTGRLVGIAARQGADRGVADQAAYSAAKAGLVRLVESVAAEFHGHITAHAIAPSTLTKEPGSDGVSAAQIADLCVHLCLGAGDALNGATLRAYGLDG